MARCCLAEEEGTLLSEQRLDAGEDAKAAHDHGRQNALFFMGLQIDPRSTGGQPTSFINTWLTGGQPAVNRR